MAPLDSCPQCGRLFAPESDRAICEACARGDDTELRRVEEAVCNWNLQSTEDIGHFAGLSLDQVLRALMILFEQTLDPQDERRCKRCNVYPPFESGPYCHRCQFDLYIELKNAADQLAQNKATEVIKGTAHNLLESLRSKRGRLGRGRLDPTPRGRY